MGKAELLQLFLAGLPKAKTRRAQFQATPFRFLACQFAYAVQVYSIVSDREKSKWKEPGE
jgi:hypothetical protein